MSSSPQGDPRSGYDGAVAGGLEGRILVLAPTGRDAGLIRDALVDSGFRMEACDSMHDLCMRLEEGAGAAVIAKEALTDAALRRLDRSLSGQPRWSRLPMIILTRTGGTTPEDLRHIRSLQSLATATLLERPFRIVTLTSAAHVALERRHAQYEIRDHLRERASHEEALRQREEQLSRLNAELEGRVTERTRQLEWANARLRAEIAERRELERKVAALSIGAQRRIGGELHESIAQQIAALGFLARSIKQKIERGGRPDDEQVDRLNETLDQLKVQIGQVIRGLTPVEVDADGLMLALDDLAERARELHGIHCRLECPDPVPLHDNFTATQLYHIAEEAVRNAVAHSSARRVVLRLVRDGDRIQLAIDHDGRQVAGSEDHGDESFTSSLRIMRYRCDLVGAEFSQESLDGTGARVRCTLGPRA